MKKRLAGILVTFITILTVVTGVLYYSDWKQDKTLQYQNAILNIAIYSISIIFSFIVILIVCGKIFLKEQVDYGIYKALGFTSGVLRLQFSIRFLFVALAGSVIGILANLLFNDSMMNALLRNMGITSFKTQYSLPSMLFPVIVVCVSFFFFSYLIAEKIKKVTMKNLNIE